MSRRQTGKVASSGAPDVGRLRGVGARRAQALGRLGITTVAELLEHFPRRYEEAPQDRTLAQAVSQLGRPSRLQVEVLSGSGRRGRRGTYVFQAIVHDETDTVAAVWFNRPYLQRQLTAGRRVTLVGAVERQQGRLQLVNPRLEGAQSAAAPAGLLPVYPAAQGLNQPTLRNLVRQALTEFGALLADPLPQALRERLTLPPREWALKTVHFPENEAEAEIARRRLAFDELLFHQLALLMTRPQGPGAGPGISHRPRQALLDGYLDALPFTLTAAQQRVSDEILADMAQPRPMQRLVQGDVGSGKTAVATLALLAAVGSGSQAAFMAPTELLAQQHFENLAPRLENLGVKLALLTGSLKARRRQQILAGLANGNIHGVVGTHALLEPDINYKRLGLVITDEQHRFGVRQRAALQAKGEHPDVLVMTATPIPRTLALTLYGDLDVSVIDELPPGRQPTTTYWVSREGRGQAYGFMRRQVRQGHQAYVVCPLIEESAESDLKNAVHIHRNLQNHMPESPVGLLHGRLTAAEKQQVMDKFRRGQIKVLVATTVVEVGVDVPAATIMIVEDAHRFGLAQLHQLRGRIGRGHQPGVCLLLAEPTSDTARQRLAVMEETTDGFVIAQRDMELRGPGEVFGTRQHGLPTFKAANPLRDHDLMAVAQREARRLAAVDGHLTREEHAGLRRAVYARYAHWVDRAVVG